MIAYSSFLDSYNKIKEQNANSTPNKMEIDDELKERDYLNITEYLTSKFKEASEIFSKLTFEHTSINELVKISTLKEYNENDIIFNKDEECINYYFILYGDINCYEDINKDNHKLFKTLSAGSIFGHKIKERYKFYGKSNGKLSLLVFNKKDFDNLINKTNQNKLNFKLNFIKKFFPHMRLFTNDVLENLLQFFIRERYFKYTRIFKDGEYDEFIYLIIKGKVGVGKKPNKMELNNVFEIDMNEYNTEDINTDRCNNSDKMSYIILEKFSRGDLFGIYSSLKNNRNNYTAIALENTEIYKISKSHLLFYFGGNSGFIPKALKSTDTLQQNSHNLKIEYIKDQLNNKYNFQFYEELMNKYFLNYSASEIINMKKRTIDESKINNNLCDAWKTLKNLDSKLSALKESLLHEGKSNNKGLGFLGGNANKPGGDFFSKFSNNNTKDFNKVSGDGTGEVNARKLFVDQKQIKSLGKLGSICGIKKKADENDIKKLAEIKMKVEGKRNLLVGGFDEDIKKMSNNNTSNNKSSISISNNNKNVEIKENKDIEKENKDIEKEKKDKDIPIEKKTEKAMNESNKGKNFKHRHSLRNLLE